MMDYDELIDKLCSPEGRRYCLEAAGAIAVLRDKLAARDRLVDKLETENYRLRGLEARRCADCLSWTRDMDPATMAEIHRCKNPRSPRLNDITLGGDSCGHWTPEAV